MKMGIQASTLLRRIVLGLIIATVPPAAGLSAEPPKSVESKAEAKAGDSKPTEDAAKLTVAVLEFSAKDPSNPALGKQISEALTAGLANQKAVNLVDRQSMQRIVQEHALNLSGLVDSDKAVQIGKLVGARIMITGSAFTLGKKLFITSKLIGTETSLMDSVSVSGAADADLGDLVNQLTDKVSARIRVAGPKIVAAPAEPDPLADLQKELAGRKLPTVAVIITEEHHSAPVTLVILAGRAIDPPVETEMKQALIAAGFTVQDVPQNDLAKFARDWKASDVNSWPRSLAKVDLLITGESFSEFGARIGNLTSCSARAEINIIDRKDGKVIQADKTTARAADLSENIAAKGALQKTGHQMAVQTLDFFVHTLSKPVPATATKSQ
jgi:TolB-like protein